jgi:ABC-2 type transport system ATP-binding protein
MISVEHLSKTYGSTSAIQDVTFAVEQGEILGFLGPNGAGKTTTMRILAGYLPATTGTARIAGYDVHENSMAVRQKIGYLPEIPPLYPEMTVEGYLHFVARLKRVSAGDRPTKVNQAIARCGLEEKRQVTIRKLSKGFRQRVGIAQAIVHNPPVIILDEPTVGLDPRQIIEVRNLIKSLAGDHTIILSTHILPEVSMTCSQVAIINRGIVVASDSLENLMAQTQGKSYQVELEAKNPQLIQRMIQDLSGVTAVDLLSHEHLPANRYRFRVTAAPEVEVAPKITSSLSGVGVKLYEMRRLGTSLEDVFLRLTSADMPSHNDQDEQISLLPSSQEWWDEPIAENAATPIDFSQIHSEAVEEKYPPLPSSLEWWEDVAAEVESSPKKSRNPLAFLWNWFKKGDRKPVDLQPVAKGKKSPEQNYPKSELQSEKPEAIAQEKPEISSDSESLESETIGENSDVNLEPETISENSDVNLEPEPIIENSDPKLQSEPSTKVSAPKLQSEPSTKVSDTKLQSEPSTKVSDTKLQSNTKLQIITEIQAESSENVAEKTESNLVEQPKELGEE